MALKPYRLLQQKTKIMKDDKGFEETKATKSEVKRNRRYCLSKHCLLGTKGDLLVAQPLKPLQDMIVLF